MQHEGGCPRLLFGRDEQDDHFERKVKEHHTRIDVLGDVAARTRQFGRDAENIGFVDETGEIARKVFFTLREIIELRQMEIVDKVFAHQLQGIVQEGLLPLAPPSGHAFRPSIHFFDVAQVAFAHEEHEHVEKLLFVVTDGKLAECAGVTAGGAVSSTGGIFCRKTAFTHQRLGNFGLGERLERHPLGARNDGGQQLFGMIGAEQKDGLARRFFEQLQDLVSTGDVHQLGQPNNDHFVATARRDDAHFAQ